MSKRPKRRKYKDNPYTLNEITINNKYFISFKDSRGGYIDGKKDECLLRFVCKTHFNETKRSDLTEEFIKNNS